MQVKVDKIMSIRTKIINQRKGIYELTLKEVEERSKWEQNIKRPYFHVNPLDIAQLDNWMEYLNWEIKNSCYSKIKLLFERCLISCALYEHMWIRVRFYFKDNFYV
jgi:pre-mRNA-processing factor 39